MEKLKGSDKRPKTDRKESSMNGGVSRTTPLHASSVIVAGGSHESRPMEGRCLDAGVAQIGHPSLMPKRMRKITRLMSLATFCVKEMCDVVHVF